MYLRHSIGRRGSSFHEGISEFRNSIRGATSSNGSQSINPASEDNSLGSDFFEFGMAKNSSMASLSMLEDEEDNDEYEIDSPASKSMGHASAFSTLMKHGGMSFISFTCIRSTWTKKSKCGSLVRSKVDADRSKQCFSKLTTRKANNGSLVKDQLLLLGRKHSVINHSTLQRVRKSRQEIIQHNPPIP